jgi:hypothetical protein
MTPDGGTKTIHSLLLVRQACEEHRRDSFVQSANHQGSSVDIIHHMDQSLMRISAPLVFLSEMSKLLKKKKTAGDKLRANKNFLRGQAGKLRQGNFNPMQLLAQAGITQKYLEKGQEEVEELHVFELADASQQSILLSEEQPEEPCFLQQVLREEAKQRGDYGAVSKGDYEALTSEIQLRTIVQNMDKEDASQQSDGDEAMVKDGTIIIKISRETLEIGATAVGMLIVGKTQKVFDLIRQTIAPSEPKLGHQTILTKFKDKPYSYELILEYEDGGTNRLPTVKAMNWTGKTTPARVIRGFVQSTPVVQRCPNPRGISRLVIVPKLAHSRPGQG